MFKDKMPDLSEWMKLIIPRMTDLAKLGNKALECAQQITCRHVIAWCVFFFNLLQLCPNFYVFFFNFFVISKTIFVCLSNLIDFIDVGLITVDNNVIKSPWRLLRRSLHVRRPLGLYTNRQTARERILWQQTEADIKCLYCRTNVSDSDKNRDRPFTATSQPKFLQKS